jgi:hypothetical protein
MRRLGKSRLGLMLLIVASLAAAGLSRQAPAASALSPVERALDSQVKADTIRQITTRLASPDLEGRGTGQQGADRAAKYLAEKFAGLGLKPLGDSGSFLQTAKFTIAEIAPGAALKVRGTSLKFGDEFVLAPPFPEDDVEATGGLVSVGFGVVSPDLKRDDLAGLDLTGKIALVLVGGPPHGVNAAAWESPRTVIGRLVGKGVAGVILLNYGNERQSYSMIAEYLTRRQIALADAPKIPLKLPPIILVSDSGAEKLFAESGGHYSATREKALNGEAVSKDLGQSVSITAKIKREEETSSNVAGVIEGSDPVLRDQAVVYSAHYDAFGISASGKIFPGAADNALGVGEMISIGEAFASLKTRPKRSIILLAFTGEEAGLLGAEYWVSHPTWPLAKVAADLNFDGIGTEVWGPVKQIVGYGADQSEIGKILESAAAAEGAAIAPDPFPEEGAFYRSDHYAFVQKGVPALMPLGVPGGDQAAFIQRAKKWLVTDYHMPTDTVRPDWDWQGPRTLASIILIVGDRIANADSMPDWLPSSSFKKAREGATPSGSKKP